MLFYYTLTGKQTHLLDKFSTTKAKEKAREKTSYQQENQVYKNHYKYWVFTPKDLQLPYCQRTINSYQTANILTLHKFNLQLCTEV